MDRQDRNAELDRLGMWTVLMKDRSLDGVRDLWPFAVSYSAYDDRVDQLEDQHHVSWRWRQFAARTR